MSLLSSTIGRFVPRFRTLEQWAQTYEKIVESREISGKTLANRKGYVRRIVGALGGRPVGSIKPHEIAGLVMSVAAEHPHTAKRTLVELKDMFNQMMIYGWINRNPTLGIKAPKVKVARRRLSLEDWQAIQRYANEKCPPWVSRLFLLAIVTGQRRADLLGMRFSDVWAHDDGNKYLHVIQQKTGERVAIPLELRLEAIDMSVGEAIEMCHDYAPLLDKHDFLLRKSTGYPPCLASASWRFEHCREMALPPHKGDDAPSSLHECRSLAARLYMEQGINPMNLLGHTKQEMTALYLNDRGLNAKSGKWRTLDLPPAAASA